MSHTHFTSLEQLRNARPNLDPACLITLHNFEKLAPLDYDFEDDALCQVESIKTRGRQCRHKHRQGWLGICTDGKEGLIGSTCGPKYFTDHQGFKAQLAHVTLEQQLDELTGRLEAIKGDATYLPNIEQLRERLRTVREQSKELIDELPDDVADRLRAMAKRRNSDLLIEVERKEKVENEQTGEIYERSQWLPQVIGAVAGLGIAERAPIFALQEGLLAVRKAFTSIDASRKLGKNKLNKQVKAFEPVPNLATQVAAFEAAWAAFSRPENIRNLWLLSRRPDSQLTCMRLAFTAAGIGNPSNNKLHGALHDAGKALSLSNGNRRVRPVSA
jgi:hypothetical protein